ncbi:sulfurtransferase TusA family protein [Neisseria meningitidis]|uniref:sulfurtransferase TusA family protein n=1 Tax=Neisseria meningitidis TaxID=487 RepID=UPI000C32D917|nr:sulfurtransferase TusA family protein [Neisseria meningitidis]MBG8580736.1 sulfurtransferase TusA family protein [Neisseria meningitidis]MBG8589423.1 sulfurtransferase TusA family protein [Neisseria meningitidis]MBG8649141.1 sulfurtransferase TusA family protein [Neisseria meningitidis]MBG8653478.1 sulfurtransferase TusA family protein [Neisseria meningitidis]MBG8669156.1 sulfurtransferase TusA family protein [Neisseria meningitidis]
MNSETLDVIGLKCPLPILRAKKALAQMQQGDVLTVLATDGGAPGDFEAFCRQTGHVLLDTSEQDGVFRLVVQHK